MAQFPQTHLETMGASTYLLGPGFLSLTLFSHLFGSDTICDLGGVNELANYGEYSGAPSEQQTYDYAKTILSLMTREKHPDGEAATGIRQGSACPL